MGLVPPDGPDVRPEFGLSRGDDYQQDPKRADDPEPVEVHEEAACPEGAEGSDDRGLVPPDEGQCECESDALPGSNAGVVRVADLLVEQYNREPCLDLLYPFGKGPGVRSTGSEGAGSEEQDKWQE